MIENGYCLLMMTVYFSRIVCCVSRLLVEMMWFSTCFIICYIVLVPRLDPRSSIELYCVCSDESVLPVRVVSSDESVLPVRAVSCDESVLPVRAVSSDESV
ncbi:hypothetical protein VIGAN_03163800 [Vigna angularis var. angularis]|uniref:Uncharacterized protein n=1 Tax=Vigna angularis var. angularis TaxID=157739 RepID=A0A0S3RME5_PHAAN|nr:hypothetical protein VIGAN_03163800 [Vigna angularis var. angularis]